jgi:hypothetical protein
MSYFASADVAKDYAGNRPHFHAEAMRRIRAFAGLRGRLPRALDGGCGAGLSRLAVTELAGRVVGVARRRPW